MILGATLGTLAIAGPVAAGVDPILAAAGDIACSPADVDYNGGLGTAVACRMKDTSDLLVARQASLSAVLLLGDNQYDTGDLASYQTSFAPSWGRLGSLIHPAVGNHEYGTPGASGYFAFFGAAAGDPAEGYYSFELGAWHIVVLNSNCAAVGGCDASSPQVQWLRADLAAHPVHCTLAAWHHPLYSSGPHGNDATYAAFWDVLMEHRADLVLVGHDHLYQRFAAQDSESRRDVVRGLREFLVGTGGRNLYGLTTVRPNVDAFDATTFGALFLTLKPDSYDWSFESIDGGPVRDQGSGSCHRLPTGFYPIQPCRVLDTRVLGQGPSLAAGQPRAVQIAGVCGIPQDATAVASNWTVTNSSATGSLTVLPAGGHDPGNIVVAIRAGRTRAGFATLGLGLNGSLEAVANLPNGATDLVVDVTGYFR